MDMRRLSGRHGSKLPRHRFSVVPKLYRYLCCDSSASVYLNDRVVGIAGKPAPTEDCIYCVMNLSVTYAE